MAANRQQGIYLGGFIAAFTAIPMGLMAFVYDRVLTGSLVTAGGLLLLAYSLLGLRRIKPLEFLKQ